MINFVILALIGSVAITIITAILGNFMVWRRVSYLGDAIGHSSLLGIAIGIFFNEVSLIWIFLVCIFFSFLLVMLKKLYTFSFESIIVLNVQLFLSVALIILSWYYISNNNTVINYFFGDLLLLTLSDVLYLYLLMSIVILYTYAFWNILLLLSINEEIAYAENIKVTAHNICFMSLVASSIAILVKFIGVFLMPSLLIIPTLAANYITRRSPLKCFVIAAIVAYVAIVLGVSCSFYVDIPVTPLITLLIIIEFILLVIIKSVLNFRNQLSHK